MDNSPNRRYPLLRLAASLALGLAPVAVAVVALRTSHTNSRPTSAAFFKKAEPDKIKPGDNKRMAFGAFDSRWPEYTADVESYLLRAYPLSDIPGEATLAAHAGWASLNASAHSGGEWQLIGPSK